MGGKKGQERGKGERENTRAGGRRVERCIKQQWRPDSFPRIGLGTIRVKAKQPERTGAHAAVSWEPAQKTPSY